MKTMKKVLALVLVVALTATAAVNLTLAYLQDQDEDVNVMTLGNVYIEQIEQERGEGGAMKEFAQNKPLYPAIYDGTEPAKDGDLYNAPNVVDKMVSVKNTGASSAYVRTIFAFELGSATVEEWKNLIVPNTTGPWVWTYVDTPAVIEGNNYYIVEALYPTALASQASTGNSLLQVYMKKEATNEDVEKLDGNGNGTYDILVVSQAIQTLGFGTAAEALDEGFYDVSATEHPWTNGVYIPAYAPKVEPDANGVVNVPDGETVALYGTYDKPILVTGEGTLELHDVTIKAPNGNSALTLATGSNVKLVVVGNVSLTGDAASATMKTGLAESEIMTTASNTNPGNGKGCGIYVPAGVTLDLSGKGGSLTAIGGGGSDSKSGSGIGGEGTINIYDLKDLTAKGYGEAGFGIGGATKEITIANTHITYAKGGYVQSYFTTDKGKQDPQGGAAIGSMYTGDDVAVITLDNVVIDKAEGGSKSAGIGARYWTAVTVNIKDSTIKSVTGGNASAGIGGSRVHGEKTDSAAEQTVTININNSNITAQGGEYGAGIGSGYDTYCHVPALAPMCTINIKGNSVINATGGKYAAGIGTGYHNGQLSGEIEASVAVTAASGEKFYKSEYTQAQDVGFGVIDPKRDGLNNTCTFNYKGTIISLAVPETSIEVTPENIAATTFDQDGTYKFKGTFDTINVKVSEGKNIVLDGSGATVTGSVVLNAPGVLGSYSEIANKDQSGSYTVKGFNAKQMEVFAYNTDVIIADNVTEFIHVCGGNLGMDIKGNTVDAKVAAHTTVQNSTRSEYGVYLYVTDYELSFTNNTVKNAYSHAIGIFGRQSEENGFDTAGAGNTITAFAGNAISIPEGAKANRSALKIWACGKYAPQSASTEINDAAKALVKMVEDGNNTITKRTGDSNFCFYNAPVVTDYTVN